MDTDGPSPADEDLSVHLQWPSEQGDAERRTTPDAAPGGVWSAPVHQPEVVASYASGP